MWCISFKTILEENIHIRRMFLFFLPRQSQIQLPNQQLFQNKTNKKTSVNVGRSLVYTRTSTRRCPEYQLHFPWITKQQPPRKKMNCASASIHCGALNLTFYSLALCRGEYGGKLFTEAVALCRLVSSFWTVILSQWEFDRKVWKKTADHADCVNCCVHDIIFWTEAECGSGFGSRFWCLYGFTLMEKALASLQFYQTMFSFSKKIATITDVLVLIALFVCLGLKKVTKEQGKSQIDYNFTQNC